MRFNFVGVDKSSEYSMTSYSFSPNRQGYYYIGMSVGLRSGLPVEVKLRNTYPPVGLMRKFGRTFQTNVVDMISRDTTAVVNVGDRVSLESGNGGVTSTAPEYQTAFYAYNLNDVADLTTLFHVASNKRQDSFGRVDFNEILLSPQTSFDISGNQYTCRYDGTYVFHFSAGAVASKPVRLYLKGALRQYSLRRESTNHNDLDTLSRTVITECTANQVLTLELEAGEVYSDGTDYQVSWIGFRYAPQATSTAFAGYRTFSWQGGMFQPVEFDVKELSGDFDGTRFYCRMGGVYYVYFSSGYDQNTRIQLSLIRTRQSVQEVIASVSADGFNNNGIDFVGRGVVVQTYQGDTLHIRTDQSATLYADPLGFQISFVGIKLYN